MHCAPQSLGDSACHDAGPAMALVEEKKGYSPLFLADWGKLTSFRPTVGWEALGGPQGRQEPRGSSQSCQHRAIFWLKLPEDLGSREPPQRLKAHQDFEGQLCTAPPAPDLRAAPPARAECRPAAGKPCTCCEEHVSARGQTLCSSQSVSARLFASSCSQLRLVLTKDLPLEGTPCSIGKD